MKKNFIFLLIASMAITVSIEAKSQSTTNQDLISAMSKALIMKELHPYGKNSYIVKSSQNTPFSIGVQTLIKKIDVNFQDSNYWNNTPLNSAARFGANNKLSFLLANGAGDSLTIKNKEGLTPLANAALNGNFATVALILDWSKKYGTKGTNDPKTLLSIKDSYTDGAKTPLGRAIYSMRHQQTSGRNTKDYENTIMILEMYTKIYE